MSTTATTTFTGFPRDGFAFLADLATDNTREFFDAHRETYESALLQPAKGFVIALGEQLQARVSPGIRAEPRVNGSILRITRDTRFTTDKRPYKERTYGHAGRLFVQLSSRGLYVGTGYYRVEPDRLRTALRA